MAEAKQRGQERYHARVSEAEARGAEAVVSERRLGHLRKSDHIGSRLCVYRLGVTQAPVGIFTNGPEGLPVLLIDATTDPKVASVTDHRLSSQGAMLLEILLEARRLVDAAQLRVDAPGDHLGREPPRRAGREFAVKQQNDGGRPADVQVVADEPLEEGTSRLRSIDYPGIRDLELPEGQFVHIAGASVVCSERRRQTQLPAPEEALDRTWSQPVADPLEGGWIGA